MHTRFSCKPLLWRSSEPPLAQRSMINHNSLPSCRSSTHIYLPLLRYSKNHGFHDSLITVHCNGWDENQPIFMSLYPVSQQTSLLCHSLPLCLLEFLRGTITILISELIITNSFTFHRTGNKKPPKKKYIYFFFFKCPINHNNHGHTSWSIQRLIYRTCLIFFVWMRICNIIKRISKQLTSKRN